MGKQDLKIYSTTVLENHTGRLRLMKIENMEATRPEDKEEILAGIPDHEAFNDRLQELLFQELFPAWSSLDAELQMHRIARMSRWGQISFHRQSFGIFAIQSARS